MHRQVCVDNEPLRIYKLLFAGGESLVQAHRTNIKYVAIISQIEKRLCILIFQSENYFSTDSVCSLKSSGAWLRRVIISSDCCLEICS